MYAALAALCRALPCDTRRGTFAGVLRGVVTCARVYKLRLGAAPSRPRGSLCGRASTTKPGIPPRASCRRSGRTGLTCRRCCGLAFERRSAGDAACSWHLPGGVGRARRECSVLSSVRLFCVVFRPPTRAGGGSLCARACGACGPRRRVEIGVGVGHGDCRGKKRGLGIAGGASVCAFVWACAGVTWRRLVCMTLVPLVHCLSCVASHAQLSYVIIYGFLANVRPGTGGSASLHVARCRLLLPPTFTSLDTVARVSEAMATLAERACLAGLPSFRSGSYTLQACIIITGPMPVIVPGCYHAWVLSCRCGAPMVLGAVGERPRPLHRAQARAEGAA